MVDTNLKIFSNEIKISVKELIKKLSEIGISKNENDCINITEKKNLLKYLENKKKPFLNTFILQRKTRKRNLLHFQVLSILLHLKRKL